MSGRRIINFYDIETSGENDPAHRIIEACCGLFDFDTEEHIKTFTWRYNPQRSIDRRAQKVHGISLDMLANEPTFESGARRLRGVIEPIHLWVAHNGDDFDFPFTERELARVGERIIRPKTFDTMKQARWATANGKYPKLGELAMCLDVEYNPEEAHAASYDMHVMAQCFFEGRRLGFFTP